MHHILVLTAAVFPLLSSHLVTEFFGGKRGCMERFCCTDLHYPRSIVNRQRKNHEKQTKPSTYH